MATPVYVEFLKRLLSQEENEDWVLLTKICQLVDEHGNIEPLLEVLKNAIKSKETQQILRGVTVLDACTRHCTGDFVVQFSLKEKWVNRMFKAGKHASESAVKQRIFQLMSDMRNKLFVEDPAGIARLDASQKAFKISSIPLSTDWNARGRIDKCRANLKYEVPRIDYARRLVADTGRCDVEIVKEAGFSADSIRKWRRWARAMRATEASETMLFDVIEFQDDLQYWENSFEYVRKSMGLDPRDVLPKPPPELARMQQERTKKSGVSATGLPLPADVPAPTEKGADGKSRGASGAGGSDELERLRKEVAQLRAKSAKVDSLESEVKHLRLRSPAAGAAPGGDSAALRQKERENADLQSQIDDLTRERNALAKKEGIDLSALQSAGAGSGGKKAKAAMQCLSKTRSVLVGMKTDLVEMDEIIRSFCRDCGITMSKGLKQTVVIHRTEIRARGAASGESSAKVQEMEAELEKMRQQLEDEKTMRREREAQMIEEIEEKDTTINKYKAMEAKIASANQGVQQRMAALQKLQHMAKQFKGEFVNLKESTLALQASVPKEIRSLAPVYEVLQRSQKENADLLEKYNVESAKRRKLFNELVELKGNIRVFCRVRPISKHELDAGQVVVTQFPSEYEISVYNKQTGGVKKFEFDRVFPPDSSQEEVFKEVEALCTSVLDGFNVCIFAYGQTGSGKTHTMEGPLDNPGVNMRAMRELFNIASSNSNKSFDVKVQLLEIYNEKIKDLLTQDASKDGKLEIRREGNRNWVPNLTSIEVASADECAQVLKIGHSNRSQRSTNMNEQSSRSHCVFSVHVATKDKTTGASSKGTLHLVDLAGSERVSKSEVTGQGLMEAQSINKSLSALGDCIKALTAKTAHVPYRNSKLTFLLEDSLGGDSKTLMFCAVSPASDNCGETLSSLNFANRVRTVELGPAKKHADSGELAAAKDKIAKLEAQLAGRG